MPEEEKELTIEEMKQLVSLATLLPALLERISAINKEVSELKTSFNDIKNRFNTNTTAVIEYKNTVDSLLQNQPNFKNLEQNIDAIKKAVARIEATFSAPNDNNGPTPIPVKVATESKPLPKAAPKKDKDQDKVLEIVDKILAEHLGRKTRTLTTVNIKQGFKVDDTIAEKVLAWFQDKKMYNPKLHTLTFPKR